MDRIDKVISQQTNYSRKEVKELIHKRRVTVNDITVLKSDIKIDSSSDMIKIDGHEIEVKDYIYLILNKPKGYVSTRYDKDMPTVLDLISSKYLHRNLFPAGRLDKDTTGLMIITDDGNFAHNILSPKRHVKKKYYVKIDKFISDEMINGFKNGIMLNDGICKGSILEKVKDDIAIVTLTEGRYHQIKRMFGCFGAKVLELQRIQIGNFKLPSNLKEGTYRELTKEELEKISSQK